MRVYFIVVVCFISLQYGFGQSHTQRAAMNHTRMTQQMTHNFHMMQLNAGRLSARSVKKNVKYINKRLKHNAKTATKYNKKLLKLQQKLQESDVTDTKKQHRLKKWIGIYQKAIESIKKETSELELLLQKQKEFKVKKEAEKQAN